MCFLPIYSGRQACWTYQPGSHRRKVTRDFSSTFLLRFLPIFFSREGFSRFFPSSTVKTNFVLWRVNHSPLVGHFFLYFFVFSVRKNPLPGFELTSQRVRRFRGYQLSYRDDRYTVNSILFIVLVQCNEAYRGDGYKYHCNSEPLQFCGNVCLQNEMFPHHAVFRRHLNGGMRHPWLFDHYKQ